MATHSPLYHFLSDTLISLFFVICRQSGFGFVTGLTHMYYTIFIEADEMSYGESGLKMEGLMQSFGVFLLGWIIAYTGMEHADLPVSK